MNTKEISDLGLIAGLITKGYNYTGVFKQGRRVVFEFEWDENMQSLEDSYFSGGMEVDAQAYNAILRKVKSVIYQLEPNNF